ncbi:MAG TPA: aspartate aminotransferase family protein [Candidatus Dormibacteraeota bacterium]|nr:aspartate aminotransferase family protein [Candidatus Dormibacteraeota bacterium]
MAEPLTPSRSDELLAIRYRSLPRGLKPAVDFLVDRAQGSQVWSMAGDEYIDFIGGIGVLNVGHSHPKVVAAAHRQIDQLVHISAQVAVYEPYLHLVDQLCQLTPGDFSKKAILFSTGAEAVENTVKIARSHMARPGIVAFSQAFHGRTLLGMSLTDTVKPYKEGFGPFAPEIYRSPFPYQYWGWDTARALDALEESLRTSWPAERMAAFLIEPVLGEGGFVPAPFEFVQALRRLADQRGLLLIADEVQSGIGRTGRLFAIEHSGVAPDLMAIAKSLGGGFPLSAVVGRAQVMDAPTPGQLGSTYGGNPVACAAALAVLEVIDQEGLLSRAEVLGSILEERMGEWSRRFPMVGDVRVLGAMAGLELVQDRATKAPASEATQKVIDGCRERGLLVLRAGPHHNVIRTLMPLTISEELLLQGLDILEHELARVSSGRD